MCSRVALAWLHRSHVGSMMRLILAILALNQCKLWTILTWTTSCLRHMKEEKIFLITFCQLSSDIDSSKSDSHSPLRRSKASNHTCWVIRRLYLQSASWPVYNWKLSLTENWEGMKGKHLSLRLQNFRAANICRNAYVGMSYFCTSC